MIDLSHQDKTVVFEKLKEALAEKNYAEVQFPITQKDFTEAAQSFFSFLELPQSEKETLHFTLHKDDRQGYGYVKRQRGVDDKDNKEFFHYNPAIAERLHTLSVLKRDETVDFLTHAHAIYEACTATAKDILGAFETEFPGIQERVVETNDTYMSASALRFLKYEPAGTGNFLAKGHYDRGTMTLALAESAPGLRIGKNAEALEAIAHTENTALFMPALLFSEITDERFTPAWHDVIQTSEDTYRKDAARWAIVFFADTKTTRTPSLEETHTPVA